MSENDKNNGGGSDANEDSEIFKRAKSAEDALKIERDAKLKLETELAELKKKGQDASPVDTKALDERFGKIETTQQEQIISSRTSDLAKNLGIEDGLAREIITHFGGDLQKALDESRKDGTMVNQAVKQAQHKKSLSGNTPSPTASFGGEYVVEGKKKNFFDLSSEQQKQAYQSEVKRNQ